MLLKSKWEVETCGGNLENLIKECAPILLKACKNFLGGTMQMIEIRINH